MKKCLLGLFLLLEASLLWLGLAACAQQATAGICTPGVVRTETSLKACGQLTEAFVEAINSQLKAEDKILQLTSPGGDPAAAIQLARILRQRQMSLRITGICLSACAHYVFLSAKRVVVDPGSLVGFHHTSSFVYKSLVSQGRKPSELLVNNHIKEVIFFEEIGVQKEFLYAPALFAQPACVGYVNYNGVYDLFIKTRWSFVIPTRGAIEEIRRAPVLGFWPKDSSEIASTVKSWGPIKARDSFALGWPRMPGEREMFDRIKAIPAC